MLVFCALFVCSFVCLFVGLYFVGIAGMVGVVLEAFGILISLLSGHVVNCSFASTQHRYSFHLRTQEKGADAATTKGFSLFVLITLRRSCVEQQTAVDWHDVPAGIPVSMVSLLWH